MTGARCITIFGAVRVANQFPQREEVTEVTFDCVTLTYAVTSEIAETPIENAELELFVDGSAQVIEGNRRAGYAVTSTTEILTIKIPCKNDLR